ncbi:MAG: hypothetical protein IJ003_01710 [Candidatus Gastranaerophilales bacterium]|nr:hypothetical protein [Candidatus Gastranaerophilales bacterium]
MNELIAKRIAIFSVIFGAVIGLIAVIPPLIGMCLFVLSFLSAPILILYMKKNEKYLGFIDNQQGAILGAISGFFTTVGFFVTFCPMVCILHLIFKKYYSYAIPDMIQTGLWLLFVIIFMVALIFAMTNSASGMGTSWILGYIEKKPQNHDAQLDIEIND